MEYFTQTLNTANLLTVMQGGFMSDSVAFFANHTHIQELTELLANIQNENALANLPAERILEYKKLLGIPLSSTEIATEIRNGNSALNRAVYIVSSFMILANYLEMLTDELIFEELTEKIVLLKIWLRQNHVHIHQPVLADIEELLTTSIVNKQSLDHYLHLATSLLQHNIFLWFELVSSEKNRGELIENILDLTHNHLHTLKNLTEIGNALAQYNQHFDHQEHHELANQHQQLHHETQQIITLLNQKLQEFSSLHQQATIQSDTQKPHLNKAKLEQDILHFFKNTCTHQQHIRTRTENLWHNCQVILQAQAAFKQTTNKSTQPTPLFKKSKVVVLNPVEFKPVHREISTQTKWNIIQQTLNDTDKLKEIDMPGNVNQLDDLMESTDEITNSAPGENHIHTTEKLVKNSFFTKKPDQINKSSDMPKPLEPAQLDNLNELHKYAKGILDTIEDISLKNIIKNVQNIAYRYKNHQYHNHNLEQNLLEAYQHLSNYRTNLDTSSSNKIADADIDKLLDLLKNNIKIDPDISVADNNSPPNTPGK
ncbi:MAG: hypothetical protein Tsb005_20060 [Gammaproteobacteria bacterium]